MTKYLKGEDFEMFPLLSSLYDINNSQLSKLLFSYGSPMLPNVLRSLPLTLIRLPCILQMSRIIHAPALSGPEKADFWETVGILHDLDFEQYACLAVERDIVGGCHREPI